MWENLFKSEFDTHLEWLSLTNADQLTVIDTFSFGRGIIFETVEVSELLSPGASLFECAFRAAGGRILTTSYLSHSVAGCERE